jgi:hypothetical protein
VESTWASMAQNPTKRDLGRMSEAHCRSRVHGGIELRSV